MSFTDDELAVVGPLTYMDGCALAYFTAAQTLVNALPSRESLPMLDETEHETLIAHIRAIAGDLRETAGPRGAELWKASQ